MLIDYLPMCKALWNTKAKCKYEGKGIPQRQNGMCKGTEARKGVGGTVNSLVMPECQVRSLGKQKETRLQKEPGSL